MFMEADHLCQPLPWLYTSGQLSENDIAWLSTLGVSAVVNLSRAQTPVCVPWEAELVTAQAITYVHIPVDPEQPSPRLFGQFAGVMMSLLGCRVWVHCADNATAAPFVYLFRRFVLNASEAQASLGLQWGWQATPAWQEFFRLVTAAFDRQSQRICHMQPEKPRLAAQEDGSATNDG